MIGWIKMHRSIIESKQFSNPVYLKIWIWLLCRASITDKTVSLKTGVGYTSIDLKRGELIFGRKSAENILGINGSTIYRILTLLEKDLAISVKSNNKYSIISVCNYDDYQLVNDEENDPYENELTASEQLVNNKRTTSEQQANNKRTTKEQLVNNKRTQIKNDKNKENKERIKENEKEEEERDAEKKISAPLPAFSEVAAKEKNVTMPHGLYAPMMNTYFCWYAQNVGGMEPKINAAEGKALKELVNYFFKAVKNRNEIKNEIFVHEDVCTEANKWFQLLLNALNKESHVETFLKNQKKLSQINSNLTNILDQMRNGNQKNKSGINGKPTITEHYQSMDI